MSTQAELLSGVTILSASLLMHAVSAVSPSGLFRDFFGIFSVLFLMAGIGVVGVGLAHRVQGNEEREPHGDHSGPMTTEASMATGAVIGVGIGCTAGSFYGGALSVAIGTAIGTAIGAGIGVAWGSLWSARQQRPR